MQKGRQHEIRQQPQAAPIVSDHAAVDPSPTVCRWLRVPGLTRDHAVSVQELSNYLLGERELTLHGAIAEHWTGPKRSFKRNRFGAVVAPLTSGARFVAWYRGLGQERGQPHFFEFGCGATPQAAIGAAVEAALHAGALVDSEVPGRDDWGVQETLAREELTRCARSGAGQRRSVIREETTSRLLLAPTQHGWCELVIADDPDGPFGSGKRHVSHRYELVELRSKQRQDPERLTAALYSDAQADTALAVVRRYRDTDFTGRHEDGLIEPLGVFTDRQRAKAFAAEAEFRLALPGDRLEIAELAWWR